MPPHPTSALPAKRPLTLRCWIGEKLPLEPDLHRPDVNAGVPPRLVTVLARAELADVLCGDHHGPLGREREESLISTQAPNRAILTTPHGSSPSEHTNEIDSFVADHSARGSYCPQLVHGVKLEQTTNTGVASVSFVIIAQQLGAVNHPVGIARLPRVRLSVRGRSS